MKLITRILSFSISLFLLLHVVACHVGPADGQEPRKSAQTTEGKSSEDKQSSESQLFPSPAGVIPSTSSTVSEQPMTHIHINELDPTKISGIDFSLCTVDLTDKSPEKADQVLMDVNHRRSLHVPNDVVIKIFNYLPRKSFFQLRELNKEFLNFFGNAAISRMIASRFQLATYAYKSKLEDGPGMLPYSVLIPYTDRVFEHREIFHLFDRVTASLQYNMFKVKDALSDFKNAQEWNIRFTSEDELIRWLEQMVEVQSPLNHIKKLHIWGRTWSKEPMSKSEQDQVVGMLVQVLENLPQLQDLTLDFYIPGEDLWDILTVLQRCKNLQQLSLVVPTKRNDECGIESIAEYLANNQDLLNLQLSGKLTGAGVTYIVDALKTNPALQKLVLLVNDKPFRPLANDQPDYTESFQNMSDVLTSTNNHLQELHIVGNGKGVHAINTCLSNPSCQLKVLRISGNSLLSRAFSGCSSDELAKDKLSSSIIFDAVRANTSLRELHFSGVFDKESYRRAIMNKSLQSIIQMKERIGKALAELLQNNKMLQYLNVSNNAIGLIDLLHMLSLLRNHDVHVQQLSFRNQLLEEDIQSIRSKGNDAVWAEDERELLNVLVKGSITPSEIKQFSKIANTLREKCEQFLGKQY